MPIITIATINSTKEKARYWLFFILTSLISPTYAYTKYSRNFKLAIYMPNMSPAPNFKLIGHRGAAGLAAENTLESFIIAAKHGLNWIEFDIRLTKDQAWVVMHDATVDRTTTGSGAIMLLTLTEI